MTILQLSKVATDYYVGLSPKTLHSGFEKYVCTDGQICMFVNSDYEPLPGEYVFHCQTRNKNVSVQLYKPRALKSE